MSVKPNQVRPGTPTPDPTPTSDIVMQRISHLDTKIKKKVNGSLYRHLGVGKGSIERAITKLDNIIQTHSTSPDITQGVHKVFTDTIRPMLQANKLTPAHVQAVRHLEQKLQELNLDTRNFVPIEGLTTSSTVQPVTPKAVPPLVIKNKDPNFETEAFKKANYSFTLSIDGKDIEVKGAGARPDGSLIATGAFGRIFFGVDPDTGKEIAVKMVLSKNPRERQMFEKEGNFLLQMSKAQYVVGAHKVGFDGNMMFMVMDKINGEELFDKLNDRKAPLTLTKKVSILLDMAKGIQELHAEGIVHRDIKTENTLVDEHGTARLIDLGLAVTEDEKSKDVFGTPIYMAPEVFLKSSPQTKKTDIYSMGILIHEILGKTILEDPGPDKHKRWNLERTRRDLKVYPRQYIDEGIPRKEALKIALIVNNCLKLDPTERLSANKLTKALQELQQLL